jgi:competence protein ComEA
MNSLRERALAALATASTLNRKIMLLLFLILVAIGAILIALNSPKPYANASGLQTPQATESTLSISVAENFVHLVGEVANPGIYKLPSGSRLFDAVLAAGGFTELADQSSVNLAREISDGEQIVVLASGVSQSIGQTGSKTSQAKQISLNRASQLELESLPGVGPALAGRMVDWRAANGGFKKKQDLMKVSGIGQKLFAGIEALVTL